MRTNGVLTWLLGDPLHLAGCFARQHQRHRQRGWDVGQRTDLHRMGHDAQWYAAHRPAIHPPGAGRAIHRRGIGMHMF
jgi:hypothetical protein